MQRTLNLFANQFLQSRKIFSNLSIWCEKVPKRTYQEVYAKNTSWMDPESETQLKQYELSPDTETANKLFQSL